MEPHEDAAPHLSDASPAGVVPFQVTPHPAESILGPLLILFGILLWLLIAVSLIGILYAAAIGVFLFVAHMTLIAGLRGNSVKLGPQQMPELHERVARLAKRIGLEKTPDAYIVQSGGVLNAFATRFGSRNFIVLYSDMIKSCGANADALDFIIGHELGHLHRGHLRWRWLKGPARVIPFLGSAYARACEYTCDTYGKLSCTDPKKTSDSLCLLACGATFAPVLNRQAFVNQGGDLNTVFMKLGTWTMSHPPLAKRILAIDPTLKPARQENEIAATVGALVIAVLLVALPVAVGGWFFVNVMENARQDMLRTDQSQHDAPDEDEDAVPTTPSHAE